MHDGMELMEAQALFNKYVGTTTRKGYSVWTNKGALHILILQKIYPLVMVMIELEQNNEIVNSLKRSKCDRYITYVLSGHVTSGQ